MFFLNVEDLKRACKSSGIARVHKCLHTCTIIKHVRASVAGLFLLFIFMYLLLSFYKPPAPFDLLSPISLPRSFSNDQQLKWNMVNVYKCLQENYGCYFLQTKIVLSKKTTKLLFNPFASKLSLSFIRDKKGFI